MQADKMFHEYRVISMYLLNNLKISPPECEKIMNKLPNTMRGLIDDARNGLNKPGTWPPLAVEEILQYVEKLVEKAH